MMRAAGFLQDLARSATARLGVPPPGSRTVSRPVSCRGNPASIPVACGNFAVCALLRCCERLRTAAVSEP